MTTTNHPAALIERIEALRNAGAIDEAHELLDEAFTHADYDDGSAVAALYEQKALIERACGDTEEEIDCWYRVAAYLRDELDAAEGEPDHDLLGRFATARLNLASIHRARNEGVRAASVLDEAIGRLVPVATFTNRCGLLHRLAETLMWRAQSLRDTGRDREALAAAQESVETAGFLEPTDESRYVAAHAWTLIGQMLSGDEKCAEALEAWKEFVANGAPIVERFPEMRALVIDGRSSLGIELIHNRHLEEGVREIRAAAKEWEEWDEYLADWRISDAAVAMFAMARALEDLARCAEAADAFGSAADLWIRDGGDQERMWAVEALRQRAESLAHTKDSAGAHAALDRAFELAASLGSNPHALHWIRAKVFDQDERFAEAAEAYGAAIAAATGSGGDDPVTIANSKACRSTALDRCGDGEGALQCADEAIAALDAAGDERRESARKVIAHAHEARAEALVTLERCGESLASFDRAIAEWRAIADKDRDRFARFETARLLQRRGIVSAHVGDAEGALRAHGQSIAVLESLANDGDAEAREILPRSLVRRAESLDLCGEAEAARASCDAALAAARRAGNMSLMAILEMLADRHRGLDRMSAAAESIVELAGVYDELIAGGFDAGRAGLFTVGALWVRALADAGETRAAARLLESVLAHGAPDGRGFEQEFAGAIDAVRQLTEAQRRNVCALLPDGGAVLRLILGRGRSER